MTASAPTSTAPPAGDPLGLWGPVILSGLAPCQHPAADPELRRLAKILQRLQPAASAAMRQAEQADTVGADARPFPQALRALADE